MKGRIRGTGVGLALLAAAFAVSASAATNDTVEPPRCHGRLAKIVGTDGNDFLRGTPSRDVIWGGLGDDAILGSLGNDLICGGPGADLIHGGRGNDLADGGAGDGDQVIGDLGDDKMLGGNGDGDEVAGDLGIDIVNGGPGDRDLVHGDYGWDRMSGGSGGGDIVSFATDVAAGRGGGVWASLAAHKAFGDGHDKLFGFEALEGSAFADTLTGSKAANKIDGGPGDDHLFGGGGGDMLDGGQGKDACKGAKGRTTSCGREKPPKASAYVQLDSTAGGGAGLEIVGGGGPDKIVVAFDEKSRTFRVSATKGLAIGAGCSRPPKVANRVSCPSDGPARWLMADLGPGDDSLEVEGSLTAVGSVRFAGGYGDDVIRGGPEDDLIESGRGSDRLYGGPGADGLVGGLPGPTWLYGGANGDLLAGGGGCAGGAIVGGPGRDDASFAETDAHPGLLIVSLAANVAYIDVIRDCKRVHLSPTNEDMEGSFDNDILIGNSRANSILGQPGEDRFYGNGGDDVIDARDGVRDEMIQCGRGKLVRPKGMSRGKVQPVIRGKSTGRALTDSFDPSPVLCEITKHGEPVPGLNG